VSLTGDQLARAAAAETVAVWDPWVRVLHWTLAASVLVAWFTHQGAGWLHLAAGYTALAAVAARVVLGLVSRSEHARFSSFVRPVSATWAYARDVLGRREERFIGHNPLGGWMIVALLLTVAVSAGSGWLYTTDRFWGVAWVGDLHAYSSDLLPWLIALHLAGVVFTSWRHRENLITAMVFGRKRAGGPREHRT
jgi:cytochrome b